MASPSPPATTPPPPADEGYAFAPADDALVSVFLRRRIAGEPLPGAAGALFFHDADIYAAEPGALTAGLRPAPGGGSWFFFTQVRPKSGNDSRRSRRVGGGAGTWHSEHAPRDVVDGEGNRVGHAQLFSYQQHQDGKKKERTGWYMTEYRAADQESNGGGGGGGGPILVLCKIYQSRSHSRRAADGSASRPPSTGSGRRGKRKATEERVDQASAPVRRRLFLASPEPTPTPAAAQDKIAATSELTTCFAMPDPPEASQGETRASDRSFSVAGDGDAPPAAAEHCCYLTEIPLFAPGAGATTSEDVVEQPPEASPRGNAAELDWSFLEAGGGAPPPAPEPLFDTNLVDVGDDISGIPLLAPGTGSSGPSSPSCPGDDAFLGRSPMVYKWDAVNGGFKAAAPPHACGLPPAPVKPSAAGSWSSGGPVVWSC